MTDTPHDDELVSAYLDGEATPDEVARVESDPVLLARVEAFRAAIGLTAQAVAPVPQGVRDAHIAAALAAADEVLPHPRIEAPAAAPVPPPPGPAAPPPPAPVVDLAARRRRANRTWLAAAAAIAVAVLAIPLVLRSSDDDTKTTAATTENTGTTSQERPSAAEESDGNQGGGDGKAGAEALQHDLGDFVSWAALHRSISKELAAGADLEPDYTTPCSSPDDLAVESGGVASVGATEKEQATWFVGTDKDTGDQVILILDADCDQRVREKPAG